MNLCIYADPTECSTGVFAVSIPPGGAFGFVSSPITITEESYLSGAWEATDIDDNTKTKYSWALVKLAIRFRGHTFAGPTWGRSTFP